ncbi:MAG TPA: hypothetical protein V6D20_23375 [Candidatus Obscuribacterales bacterium]
MTFCSRGTTPRSQPLDTSFMGLSEIAFDDRLTNNKRNNDVDVEQKLVLLNEEMNR